MGIPSKIALSKDMLFIIHNLKILASKNFLDEFFGNPFIPFYFSLLDVDLMLQSFSIKTISYENASFPESIDLVNHYLILILPS